MPEGVVVGYTDPRPVTSPGFMFTWPSGDTTRRDYFSQQVKPDAGTASFATSARIGFGPRPRRRTAEHAPKRRVDGTDDRRGGGADARGVRVSTPAPPRLAAAPRITSGSPGARRAPAFAARHRRGQQLCRAVLARPPDSSVRSNAGAFRRLRLRVRGRPPNPALSRRKISKSSQSSTFASAPTVCAPAGGRCRTCGSGDLILVPATTRSVAVVPSALACRAFGVLRPQPSSEPKLSGRLGAGAGWVAVTSASA